MEVTKDKGNESIIHKSVTTSLVITNLDPDSSYYARVAGHTVEAGPYSRAVHLHTLEDGTLL